MRMPARNDDLPRLRSGTAGGRWKARLTWQYSRARGRRELQKLGSDGVFRLSGVPGKHRALAPSVELPAPSTKSASHAIPGASLIVRLRRWYASHLDEEKFASRRAASSQKKTP